MGDGGEGELMCTGRVVVTICTYYVYTLSTFIVARNIGIEASVTWTEVVRIWNALRRMDACVHSYVYAEKGGEGGRGRERGREGEEGGGKRKKGRD